MVKSIIKILPIDALAPLSTTEQFIKAILLFDLNLGDIMLLRTPIERLISNGTSWFCVAGAYAKTIEDTVDYIIEDYAIQHGDIFLNVVTISDTNINQAIWQFKHLPDFNKGDVGYALYNKQKYNELQISTFINAQLA